MKQINEGPIISEEIFLVGKMIDLYYQGDKTEKTIPADRMHSYATKRLQHCRFGEAKTTCQKCPIHCYQPTYRQQMKQIMGYAGPRMLWHHPILTLRHGLRGIQRKKLHDSFKEKI